MGTIALRQLLKSFCNNSEWKYAVLWQIRHGNPMILTWEDGYCDHQKPREPVKRISHGINFSGVNEMFSSRCQINTCSGSSGGYSIGQVVADMSRSQYNFGEGVVGKVADTGNHFWINLDEIFAGEGNCKLVPEYPEEWLLQSALGIKTILLIPVLPRGVLQLGSWEEVVEDLAMVSDIKRRFSLHNIGVDTGPFTIKGDIEAELSPSLISTFMDYFDKTSAITLCPSISEESIEMDDVKPDKNNLQALNQVVPVLTAQDTIYVPGKDLPEILENAGQLEMLETKLLELSCLEEELLAYSQCYKDDEGLFEEFSNGIANFYAVGHMVEQPFREQDVNDTSHKNFRSFLSFPKHCELHKALGPAFQGQTNENSWDTSMLVEDLHSGLSLVSSRDHINSVEPSWIAKGGDAGYLLEAVVSNAYSGSEEKSCNRSISVKSSTISSVKFTPSFCPQSQYEVDTSVEDGDSVPWSHNTSAFVAKERNAFTTSASFNSNISTLVDKEQQEKNCQYLESKKGTKLSNVSKRKARPGDNQRPRPRDRQMIQDRLKELRELVPNGTKCSIDGLLDQTIKHMLYLRSVTDQAEKLKQWGHHEAADKKSKSSKIKDDSHNGTSWAFELGKGHQVCPILVEDLPFPGHLLIEMLCNEHGFFLEIAQEIRRLNLTILKGTIETRSNNTWAYFIVETSKGFHRMDIFWPLMHLLQRRRYPSQGRF